MPSSRFDPGRLEVSIERLRARARKAMSFFPGDRPAWVVIDVEGAYPVGRRRPPLPTVLLPYLGIGGATLEELVAELRALAAAPWLEGVLFRVQSLRADLVTVWSIRRAIDSLRRAGKKTIAWVPNVTQSAYYLASAAETVVVPESADIELKGFGVMSLYLKDALDKHGVRYEKTSVGGYKSAMDELVRSSMSDAQREQLDALLASLEKTWVADVAASRKRDPESVRKTLDEGFVTAARAKELGLVDRLAYDDEIVGKGWKALAEAERWLPADPPVGDKRVAIVSLVGGILVGRSRRTPVPLPLFGGAIAGSETIVSALRTAGSDPSTAAVVFYVSSGGGSALASDLIWREVRRVRAKKPVVAVMGAVAASGGYYVCAPANRIVASPHTVTGSIGVVTGKLVVDRLLEKHGVHAERVQRGKFAFTLDPTRPLTDEERAMLDRMCGDVYQRFVARVAEGRALSNERVDELGRGRIWSGTDAKERGLVDELGDLDTGIARACELARLPAGAPVWHVRPRVETLLPTSDDPSTLLRLAEPLLHEPAWCVAPLLSLPG